MKIKIIFTNFLKFTLLIPPLFLISCIDIDTKEYNSNYFLNLLRKNNDEFNSKTATFSGLNLFYNQINDQNNHFFLGENGSTLIKTIDQFQKIIIDKTVELTKNLPSHLRIPDFQIKKEFEKKFLKGKTTEETLRTNNVNIIEMTRQWAPIFAFHYYFENDKSSDIINAIQLSPSYVENATNIPDILFGNNPYFITIIYPKNKQLKLKNISEFADKIEIDTIKQSVKNSRLIYKKLEKKYNLPKTEISAFSNYSILNIANFSQKVNKIKTLKPKILDLVSEKINPWNNNFFSKKQAIIKNYQEFKEKILDRILELDSNLKINENELISDFEAKFLDGKKLENILKSNNIFIYETWKQFDYYHDNIGDWRGVESEKLILRKKRK